jgi:hypothetical protein
MILFAQANSNKFFAQVFTVNIYICHNAEILTPAYIFE